MIKANSLFSERGNMMPPKRPLMGLLISSSDNIR
jgi:hypothetical protein